MNDSEQHRASLNGAAVALANGPEEIPPPYLKLIADCWEHIYDNLLLRDIIAIGQTCRQMSQMTGDYIQQYYPELKFELDGKKIYFKNVRLQTQFYQYIRRLNIFEFSDLSLSTFTKDINFDSLKTITFDRFTLNANGIELMQNALKNVEYIQLNHCEIAPNVYNQLSNYCPKLKHLCVIRTHAIGLLQQRYPSLESLAYVSVKYKDDLSSTNRRMMTEAQIRAHRQTVLNNRIDEFKRFLARHSKLKEFQTDSRFLRQYRRAIERTPIQLDLLHVKWADFGRRMALNNTAYVNLLKSLYERGFYKTLQISFTVGPHTETINAISTLTQLGKLSLDSKLFFNLGRLNYLKEFQISAFHSSVNVEQVARSAPNVEHLKFLHVDFNAILLFVRHMKCLKTIEIFRPRDNLVLHLFALNEERKNVENASKVLIYVPDYFYMPIKLQTKSLNLNLVKIARLVEQ